MSNWSNPTPGGTKLMSMAPRNAAGTDPTHSHATSPTWVVPRRRWTSAAPGFMNRLTTMSLEIAVSGSMPAKNTSIGVISAPPPIPVRPTMIPTSRPPTISGGSSVIEPWIRPDARAMCQTCVDDTFGIPDRWRYRTMTRAE